MRKKLSLLVSLIASVIATLSLITIGHNPIASLKTNAETKSYGITFNSTNNKLHNYADDNPHCGEAIAKTDLGSDIKFYYQGLKTTENSWHSLMSGGKLGNIDPIHGMQSITIVSKTDGANCTIQYLHDAYDTDECKYYNFVSKKDEKMTFDFNGYYPNHFKLRYYGEEGTYFDITSISISFYCADNPLNYPFLNVFTDDESLGTVHGRGLQKPGSNITISASPNRGVSFIGWYDRNDKLISTEVDYSFVMPSVDVMYKAKFKKDSYTISVTTNDETMGTVAGGGVFEHGDDVQIIATAKEPYAFQGWYFDFDKDFSCAFSTEPNYSIKAVQSLNLVARFVKKYKLYIISEDENKGTVIAPTECYEGFTVEIKAIAKKGYAFDHWHDGHPNNIYSTDATYSFKMPGFDHYLYASFTKGYTLSVLNDDKSKGTVNTDVSGQYKEGTQINVFAISTSGVFKGWYDGSGKVLTCSKKYSFIMPSNDYEITAKYYLDDEYSSMQAGTPLLSSDGKSIIYGLYPQTNINDPTIISNLNNLTAPEGNGWYLYNNEYYAKMKPCYPYLEPKFDNGTTYDMETTYWFRCEPIFWNILENKNSEYLLLSSVLLDAKVYQYDNHGEDLGYYINNYEKSNIRKWLNGSFYDSAFSLGNSNVQTALVDNSISSTENNSGQFVCNNTYDKVFLLSFHDYLNSDYGFSVSEKEDKARICEITDWGKANGGSTDYFTRSPGGEGTFAWCIGSSGELSGHNTYKEYASTRPAIRLTIS